MFVKLSFPTLIAAFLAAGAGAVFSAQMTSERFDVFDDRTHHLYIEGTIERGDAKQVKALTAALTQGRDEILAVSLNSPGGDVQAGMDIARHLQSLKLQVVTNVMTSDGHPGSCASACSYIYLGGSFRYLNEGSRLGVHQFRYVQDILAPLSKAARIVQSCLQRRKPSFH